MQDAAVVFDVNKKHDRNMIHLFMELYANFKLCLRSFFINKDDPCGLTDANIIGKDYRSQGFKLKV